MLYVKERVFSQDVFCCPCYEKTCAIKYIIKSCLKLEINIPFITSMYKSTRKSQMQFVIVVCFIFTNEINLFRIQM